MNDDQMGIFNTPIIKELIKLCDDLSPNLLEKVRRTLRAVFDISIAAVNNQLREAFFRHVSSTVRVRRCHGRGVLRG